MPFLGNIGPGELILVLVIALVIFGPGKLPEIGQAVGKGIREFRRAASDVTDATHVDTAAPPAPPTAGSVPTPVAQAPVAQPPAAPAPAAPAPVAPAPVASPVVQPGTASEPGATEAAASGESSQDDPGRPSA